MTGSCARAGNYATTLSHKSRSVAAARRSITIIIVVRQSAHVRKSLRRINPSPCTYNDITYTYNSSLYYIHVLSIDYRVYPCAWQNCKDKQQSRQLFGG